MEEYLFHQFPIPNSKVQQIYFKKCLDYFLTRRLPPYTRCYNKTELKFSFLFKMHASESADYYDPTSSKYWKIISTGSIGFKVGTVATRIFSFPLFPMWEGSVKVSQMILIRLAESDRSSICFDWPLPWFIWAVCFSLTEKWSLLRDFFDFLSFSFFNLRETFEG